MIRASGVKKLPIDVWIDGDGYVRKVQYAQRTGSSQPVRITMNLHDFGAPVTVKPPPANSVVDLMHAVGNG